MLECFIPSGLRIKKHPAFKPVSDTFVEEWNSVLYSEEKGIVELLLKESEKAISVVEAEIQVEIQAAILYICDYSLVLILILKKLCM